MLFELRNAATERVSHCGVLEFIAEEGVIYMPYWVCTLMEMIYVPTQILDRLFVSILTFCDAAYATCKDYGLDHCFQLLVL